jgi:tetratricopeptide (TPR) repeat protein
VEALFDEDRDKFLYELSYYYIADACFSFYSKNDTVKTLHYVDKTLALLDGLTDAQKKDVWPSLYEVAILQGNMHQDDPHYVVDRYEEARQVLLNYADTTLAANKTSLVQISQSLVVAQLKLAFKHLGEGRLEEAKNLFTSMTATMDANPSSFLLTDRAWVYYYLGAVDHRLNDTLGASRALNTALRLLEGAERSEQTTSLENTIRDLLQQVQSMPNDGE